MPVSLEELVDAAEELVKFSVSAMEISRVAGDEESGMPELVAAIEADPNFSLNVLRIANSATYLRGDPTTSVAQAITRIGRRELGQMAFAAACMEGMEALQGELLQIQSLWRDGMLIGAIARELSAVAPKAREYSFAAGMLHSIGTIVLSTQLPDQMREVLDLSLDFDLPLHVAEEQVLGFSNASLGGAMARRWGFPEPLAMAIEYQHKPTEAPEHRDVVGLMAMASTLLEQSLQHSDFDGEPERLELMLDELGLRQSFEDAQLDAELIYQKVFGGAEQAA